MTGNDGIVGVPLILGGEMTTHRVVVQSAGVAYRLRAEILTWELEQGGYLQRLCLSYAQALMTLMAQSVVCNRHHSILQQLCRWLLLSLDQLICNELHMTQELIAAMLGVRREAVTEAAGKLQAAGLIQYSRGHITVIDRSGLEARVCECYGVVRSEYERLFLMLPPTKPKLRARPNPSSLRQRAEARLQLADQALPATAWDAERLMHELKVHQIELEMQVEELRHAYDEADALRDKYADIYDFAPISYFSLDLQGAIVQMNLAGAILLGIKRSNQGRYRFASAIKPEYQAAFKRFQDEVLNNKSKTHCELVLLATDHRAEATVRIEAVPDESGVELRMVVMDLSVEKRAIQALHEKEGYQRALLDNFPFMVWLKDEQSRYLAVNELFAKNFGGASADSPVGKTDFDITSHELADAAQADDREILLTGEKRFREQLVNIHGEGHWFETYKSPVVVDGFRIGTVGFSRDITQRKAIEAELDLLARTDALTLLITYQHFVEHLSAAYAGLQRLADHRVVVIMLNLDHFRGVDESFGQAASEAVLRLFSALLRDELRKVDVAGRLGSEEFAVLMPKSDLAAARVFAERIRTKVASTKVAIGEKMAQVTASIGIAEMMVTDPSELDVMASAKNALRQAKSAGGNRIQMCGKDQADQRSCHG
jgi:diguanylate cyclase (GGDEF)-like protein/PAS domain S-box-containing protein